MKITRAWLAERKACKTGLRWFNRRFPKGLDTRDAHQVGRWPVRNSSSFMPSCWLADLILVIVGGDFPSCRLPVFPHEMIGHNAVLRDLARYLGWRTQQPQNWDLWLAVRGLPHHRRRLCLQQVARAVEAQRG
jgi:hypothetical protein